MRETFKTSRAMEYFSESELTTQMLTFPVIFLFERSPNFLLSQSLILSSAIVIKSSLLETAKSLKPLFGRHFQT